MKILELTHYTAGSCGVGKRVLNEAKMLARHKHKVRIFSSNLVKGSSRACPKFEKIGKIQITRFPAVKLGGETFISWKFEQEAKNFNPDIIIAHAYRHIHTIRALKIARKLHIPCLLVTHAPFKRERSRTLIQNLSVKLYDLLIGRRTLKKFDKVLIIAPWEIDYLLKLGVPRHKIIYSPNGVDISFFKRKKKGPKSKSIIYTGRISPIKNLEVLIGSMIFIDENFNLLIYGPAENNYLVKLNNLIIKNNLQKRVSIINKEYGIKKQLELLDKSEIFVLPSKSEGMPQSLIEAMARGKIVVGSNIHSISSIIKDKYNGFTFKENSSEDLAKKINLAINLSPKDKYKVSKEAIESVKKFKWPSIINDLNNLIKND